MTVPANTTPVSEESAKRHTLEQWLSMGHIWNIPIYQRHYSWDSEDDAGQVQLFWNIVAEHAESRLHGAPKPPHYFGAVLVNEQRQQRALNAPRVFDVVDGQQRLTTIQLALLALINSVREDIDLTKLVTEELRPYLYLGTEGKPILQPTNYDNDQYHTVLFTVRRRKADFTEVEGDEETFAKSKVLHTFKFFKDEHAKFIQRHVGDGNINTKQVIDSLRDTLLDGFDIVLIQLQRTDRPQEVFQSLNTTSKPLTTLDLIRNDVFQRAADVRPGYDQEICSSSEWQTIETPFWEEKIDERRGTTHIEAYIPRMLIAKLPGENIKGERNAVLKTYREKFVCKGDANILAEVRRMIDYEKIYRDLTQRDAEYQLPTVDVEHPSVAKSFGIFALKVWGSRDFWPAVFLVLKSQLPATEKQNIFRLLESFVVRRHASGYTTENYNQFVLEVCRALHDDISYESLKRLLLKSDSLSARYPKDDDLIANRPEHNFIGQKNARRLSTYILQILARDMGSSADEMTPLNKLSIDHILPHSWHTDPEWKSKFLSNDEDSNSENARKVKTRLNTIGNLTLLTNIRNAKKSNRPFSETRQLLCDSPLMMNRKIAENTTWDLQAIEERGTDLVNRICRIWPYPDDYPT